MKLKKLLSLLAAATMAVTAFTGAISVSAVEANGKIGDNLTWTLDANGKLTISGNGEMASPDISESTLDDYDEVYTYKVHKNDIKEVEIKEGVTTLGVCSFYQLPNLVTAIIPSTINESGGSDKSDNSKHGNWDKVNYAFAECTSLKNVTLKDGMSCIGGYQFANCTSLESITIPSSVEKWGQFSFFQCSGLKNVELKEGLKLIGAVAFAESGLESVILPSTIESWNTTNHRDRTEYVGGSDDKGYAFANCVNLSSVTLKDGIKAIKCSAFEGCSSLKKVAIPASVTKLNFAFKNCTGLEEAYIAEGSKLEQLSEEAFFNCTNLKRLEIPAGITVSYTNPRWCMGCSSLESLYLHDKDYTEYIPEANSSVKYYCYPDSATQNQLISQTKSNSRVPDITEEISKASEEVKTAVAEAEKYSEKDYTAESYGKLKALLDKAEKFDDDSGVLEMEFTADDISEAIKGLEKKPVNTPVNTPSNSQQQTPNKTTPQTPTTARPQKSTRSAAQVKKDKSAAKKAMKQAKITKLTAKSKAKKKIAVSWKKVKNAKGYQVQVSAKKNFKKVIYNKSLTKNKLTIKSSKIKSKKTYYVRVRAYATYKDANNATKKIYSKWVKKIRKVKAK